MRADPVVEREVWDFLDRYGEALGNNDAEGLLALFTGDDDAMVIGSVSGEFGVGQAQVTAFFRGLFTEPQYLSLGWERVEVFCAGDVAWFGADGALMARGNRIAYRLSGVLRRCDGQWKLAQYHGSVPQV